MNCQVNLCGKDASRIVHYKIGDIQRRYCFEHYLYAKTYGPESIKKVRTV